MLKYAYIALSLLVMLSASAAAQTAATPVGEWLVKDKTARIRILPCEKKLWGIISWEAQPGTDENNPDAAKRNQPILGLPILRTMAQTEENQWKGTIYNADNGKLYSGGIQLKSPDILQVKGCVLGILCGSEDWTRFGILETKNDTALCQSLATSH